MRRRFNPRGFRAFLDTRNLATAPIMVMEVRHCLKKKVRTPDDVDEVFANLSVSTRRGYRNSMRRFAEFMEAS